MVRTVMLAVALLAAVAAPAHAGGHGGGHGAGHSERGSHGRHSFGHHHHGFHSFVAVGGFNPWPCDGLWYPYCDDPSWYPPPVVVKPPPALILQEPTQREVVYPTGRYELHGDGVNYPRTWVWIPAAPPSR